MNKGRQNQSHTKKHSKKKNEGEQNSKKKEVQKESQMEQEYPPQMPTLKLQQPTELIDEVFLILDRISKILNEPGTRGINADVMSSFQSLVEQAKEGLTLEQLHYLQYTNRLSYIIDVSQRKCPKGRGIAHLTKIAEQQIERVEHLYEEYFADFSFLQEIKNQYKSNSSQQ